MERRIKGLQSISTVKKLRQGGVPRSDKGSLQLEIYLLENNKGIFQKELSNVLKRKALIEAKLQALDEQIAALKGTKSGGGKKRFVRESASRKAPRKTVQVMKIEY